MRIKRSWQDSKWSCSQLRGMLPTRLARTDAAYMFVRMHVLYLCVSTGGVTWALWECSGCQKLIYNAGLSLSRLLRVQGKERMLSQVSNKSRPFHSRDNRAVRVEARAVIPPRGRFSELGFWRGPQWVDVVGWTETCTWRHEPARTVTPTTQLKLDNYLAWIMMTEHSLTENLMSFNVFPLS